MSFLHECGECNRASTLDVRRGRCLFSKLYHEIAANHEIAHRFYFSRCAAFPSRRRQRCCVRCAPLMMHSHAVLSARTFAASITHGHQKKKKGSVDGLSEIILILFYFIFFFFSAIQFVKFIYLFFSSSGSLSANINQICEYQFHLKCSDFCTFSYSTEFSNARAALALQCDWDFRPYAYAVTSR